MGARAGGANGQFSGAKGSITTFDKIPKSQQLGDFAGKAYGVGYKQNGKKGEKYVGFMTKKGADLFSKAVKNGNGVKWSLGIAQKVDKQTKLTLQKAQYNKTHSTTIGKAFDMGRKSGIG